MHIHTSSINRLQMLSVRNARTEKDHSTPPADSQLTFNDLSSHHYYRTHVELRPRSVSESIMILDITYYLGWTLGAVFVVSSAFFLIVQKNKRDIVLDRLHISRRRVSGAKTPPRSFSPDIKQVQADHVDTFPPSRRHAINDLNVPAPATASAATNMASDKWKKSMVPMKTSYLEAKEDMYLPCEFSVTEVKALGNFPDYATLSGVPLPQPYKGFDISKALPRPYRPLRWAYHQTMCECTPSLLRERY